jgi:hypothetical protein
MFKTLRYASAIEVLSHEMEASLRLGANEQIGGGNTN